MSLRENQTVIHEREHGIGAYRDAIVQLSAPQTPKQGGNAAKNDSLGVGMDAPLDIALVKTAL